MRWGGVGIGVGDPHRDPSDVAAEATDTLPGVHLRVCFTPGQQRIVVGEHEEVL
jgi:hypothetical protein